MKSDVFPVGLMLDGRACLVVGSGEEAGPRARALLASGARVHAVSERPTEELSGLARAREIELSVRAFEDADLDAVWLAVLTDLNAPLAARIAELADARRVFFCAVDQPDSCSFSHLAVARSGCVSIAVSTNGRAPALAKRLREELARAAAEADLGAFAERLGRLRDATPSAERRAVLGDAVRGVHLTGRLELPDFADAG
jgi:precorrin-2 dehydrogenase/sirohydrochlorin ferrochelatase